MYEGTALSIVTGQGTFCVEGEQQTCKARGTSVMWIFLEFDQVVVVPRSPQSESLLLRHCGSFLTKAGTGLARKICPHISCPTYLTTDSI